MTLDEARTLIGSGVVYQPHPAAYPEDGVVTGVSDYYVFVRYANDWGSKATRAQDLTPLIPKEGS